MGYGGPRVQFYTANQYANYTAAIQREDAARVRSIVHQRTSVPEAEQLRQREAAFRDYEAAQAAEAARVREEETKALERRKQQEERQQRRLAARGRRSSVNSGSASRGRADYARLAQLAKPRVIRDSTATYGSVTHPEVGRNNAVYAPGVDRDRILPARPALDSGAPPPWVGSYSTHHGPREPALAAAKADAAYYCGSKSQRRSAQEEAKRRTLLQGIADMHAADEPQPEQHAADERHDADGAASLSEAYASALPHHNDEADAESVFSHGSSNGPICATGNAHMSTASTKEGVQLHLSRYGGAMTAPRPQRSADRIAMKDLTLPELSHRLVKMQAPTSQRR